MSTHHLRVVGSGDASAPPKEQTYEEWLEDLRGVVWNRFIKEGVPLEQIAVDANLRPLTVERFAWGDTKRPQDYTTRQLARAVGFRITLISARAPRQPDEPDLHEFHELIKKRA